MILLLCSTVSLILGIRTNFLKQKWIPMNFLLLFFVGILVISLWDIDWKYGFFQLTCHPKTSPPEWWHNGGRQTEKVGLDGACCSAAGADYFWFFAKLEVWSNQGSFRRIGLYRELTSPTTTASAEAVRRPEDGPGQKAQRPRKKKTPSPRRL